MRLGPRFRQSVNPSASESPACLSFDFATMSLGPATLEVDFFTGFLSFDVAAGVGPVQSVDFFTGFLSFDTYTII